MSSALCIYNSYNNIVNNKCNYNINPLIIQLCNICIYYDCFVILPYTSDYIRRVNIKMTIIIYDPNLNKLKENNEKSNKCVLKPISVNKDKIYSFKDIIHNNIIYISDIKKLIIKLHDLSITKILYYSNFISKRNKQILMPLSDNIIIKNINENEIRTLSKTKDEIFNISYACKIIDNAILHMWKKAKDINTTQQIYDTLVNEICKHSYLFAYPPIITQSCSIHPKFKNHKLDKDILVLIDIGCRYNGYCSDITRTFSLKGYFNKLQSDFYNIILNCFNYACCLLKPNILYDSIDTKVFRLLKEKLISYGLITSDKKADYLTRKLMPHTIGHAVGLNVHDATRDIFILQKNDVVTIEPGIYFPLSLQDNDGINTSMYKEIRKCIRCIRIEDTLKIQDNGSNSLTKLPTKINEINKLINLY